MRGYKDLKRLEATSGSERRRLRNSLRHEPMKRFACEAFASSVFNCYVAERLRRETFEPLIIPRPERILARRRATSAEVAMLRVASGTLSRALRWMACY